MYPFYWYQVTWSKSTTVKYFANFGVKKRHIF
jgi:hypothetical protein